MTKNLETSDPMSGVRVGGARPLVNRQHRRVLSEPEAGTRVENALAREIGESATAALKQRLLQLGPDDISLLAKTSGPQWRSGVARVTKLRLDPRYVRSGYGRLVLPALQRLASASPLEVGELLFLPAMNPRAERLLGQAFDEPSAEQVRALVAALLAEFSAPLVASYLLTVIVGGAPAAAVVKGVLDEDERLSL